MASVYVKDTVKTFIFGQLQINLYNFFTEKKKKLPIKLKENKKLIN